MYKSRTKYIIKNSGYYQMIINQLLSRFVRRPFKTLITEWIIVNAADDDADII